MSNPFEEAAEHSGGQYITQDGDYTVTVASVTDGTFSTGAPYAQVVFMDAAGRTIRQRVWYDGDHEKGTVSGLGKIANLYKVCRAALPAPDEFDTSDHYRISLPALRRLEGCVLSINVERRPAHNDPEKTYAEVAWHNFYDGLPLEFPEFQGHGEESRRPDVSAATSVSGVDEEIPF